MSAKRAVYRPIVSIQRADFGPEAEAVYMAYDDNPFTLPPALELSVEDAKARPETGSSACHRKLSSPQFTTKRQGRFV
jgi:hypothetical protein